jgi:hypothetical protein
LCRPRFGLSSVIITITITTITSITTDGGVQEASATDASAVCSQVSRAGASTSK